MSSIKRSLGQLLVGGLLVSFLGACSYFNKDDEEVREPAELQSFSEEVTLTRLWDAKIGRGAEDKAIKLVPAYNGSRVFAAAADGTVKAFSASNGRKIWESNIEDFYSSTEQKVAFSKSTDTITGGVGVGEDLVLVGSAAGELVALNQSDGSLAWRALTTSEILAPPQALNGLVVAQTIDGKVAAYNALDGERMWIYSTSVPSLTLRGTSTPIMSDLIIVGFANGRVAGLNPLSGAPIIDQRVAAATGKSDLERLVDIDGTMVKRGRQIFVATYQGNIVSLDIAAKGRVIWAKETSSISGIGEGFGNIYLATEDSILHAYAMDNGKESWDSDSLLYRDVTAPVGVSSYIVVGDSEGYLHLLAQSDGRFVGRKIVDKKGFSSAPVVDGTRIYIMSNGGKLTALELR